MNDMQRIRSFVAVSLPAETRDALRELQARLSGWGGGLRWVPPENIHLTMKFLGDVVPTKLERLAGGIGSLLQPIGPFQIRLSGVGAFPNPRRPRVVWIGITEGQNRLAEIRNLVEDAAAREGFAKEGKRFRPHLTIARIKRGRKVILEQEIDAANQEETLFQDIRPITVEAVHVYRSDLRPTGAVYTRLYSSPLRADDSGGSDG